MVHLQSHCVFCGRAHFVPDIVAISNGQKVCGVCGHTAPVFTSKEAYTQAMKGYCCPRCHMVSHHPDHLVNGYCGNCHDCTAQDIVVGRRSV